MRTRLYRTPMRGMAMCLAVLSVAALAACSDKTPTAPLPPGVPQGQLADIPAPRTDLGPQTGDLPRANFTMSSVKRIDLGKHAATVPLRRGTFNGQTVWFVITEASDSAMAARLGVNFSPRLANATNGCPGCVQTVQSTDPTLSNGNVAFSGGVDFRPMRQLVPSPTGFPPQLARPGSMGDSAYSPLVRVAGSNVVFNAPMVATGDGPFDLVNHTNTHDRVARIDPQAMEVDLAIIRAFAFGEEVVYLSFESSDPVTATLERSTLVQTLGLLPFPNKSNDTTGTRSAIFAFMNGQTGLRPEAQGLTHLVVDGRNAEQLTPGNQALIDALRKGGDTRNVLDSFTTLEDRTMARAYSPMWDLHIAMWTAEAVAAGQNVARRDANVIRQLAAHGMVTAPGGAQPLASANILINCPIVAFITAAPRAPRVGRPPLQP